VQPGSADTSGGYLVQLGSFASRANAERLAKKVRAQGFAVSVSQGSSGHYRVRVGPTHDRTSAGELAQQLRAHGHSGTIVPQ
jgi:cell division septation protein DedD